MPAEPPPPAAPDGADPSMEEILASIRRILNDDDAPADPASSQTEVPAADDDVLILDQSMMVSPSRPELPFVEPVHVPDTANVEPVAEAASLEPVVLPAKAEPIAEDTEPMAHATQAERWEPPAPTLDLVAPEAAALAASSVGSLVRTLAASRATQVYGGGPTLEDMVRAELRPLLKEWLDVYLPPMVERLVRVEIERVVGRGLS